MDDVEIDAGNHNHTLFRIICLNNLSMKKLVVYILLKVNFEPVIKESVGVIKIYYYRTKSSKILKNHKC